MRYVIFNAAVAGTSLLTAYVLFVHKMPSITTSAHFNAAVSLVHGGVFTYRTVMFLSGAPVDDFFRPTLFNYLPVLDALIVSLLWTFGFIIMLNQRLNAEMTEAKEALQESGERFRRLSNATWEGIIIHREGAIMDANESASKILGYPIEEIIGKNILTFIAPESIEPTIQKLREGTTHDQLYLELNALRKDKTIFPAEALGRPIRYNNIDARVLAFRDISNRKQAEEALRESEEKYRNILESIEDGYFEVDLAGNFTFFNPSLCRILGYPREEMPGMNNRVFMDAENAKKIFRAFNEVYVTGITTKGFDWEVIQKSGARKQIEVSVSLIVNPEEKPTGFRGIARNITERKRAEEEKRNLEERLNRSEKMEALGTLAGGVAHDLNNVLGIIVGYAELILDNVNASSSIKPHLVNIMNGGLKAAAIVDDLLTLARRGVSGRDVLDLNKIISDCQQSPEFDKLYSYHPSVEIKTDLDSDLSNVSGSSVHLGKSLYNLISNASEAMPKGGIVTIKTTNQYLDKPIHGYDQIREGDYVVLSVSDTGEGISAHDLKHIFEPFYTKKIMGRSGTGLGLAVVWGTVKDHHGYINVESEEGRGSTFTLYFPVTREGITAEAASVAISEYMGNGESILVVDDVKEQRDLAFGMLGMLNYNVSGVSSGEEAVAYLKEHKVDLMVLDMIMDPGMDGLDTYKSILEIHPKQKAIIVSGFSESDRVRAAKDLGAGAYVRKPYIKEKLGLAVRKELQKVI